MEVKKIEAISGKFIVGEIKKRSKDFNIIYLTEDIILDTEGVKKLANYIEQLEKENKELKATLKCTQDSWFEDTKKIEEYKKYIKRLDKLNAKDFIFKHELENYIPKSVIREKLKELEEYEKLAKEQINNRIVIADSDSLNYGRAEAHSKDIQELKELLGEE